MIGDDSDPTFRLAPLAQRANTEPAPQRPLSDPTQRPLSEDAVRVEGPVQTPIVQQPAQPDGCLVQSGYAPADEAPWVLVETTPGAAPLPSQVPWWEARPVTVPGTSASALREWGLDPAYDHDSSDWWWSTLVEIGCGSEIVVEGVATHWELWCDDERLASGTSMFRGTRVAVPAGSHRVSLVCRSLSAADLPRRPRPAWRSAHVPESRLRWARTSALGRIEWPGTAVLVGPWRPLRLEPEADVVVSSVTTRLVDGHVAVRVAGRTEMGGELACGRTRIPLERGDFDHEIATELAPWFPHTHGEPECVEVMIRGLNTFWRRLVGHAEITADRTDDGFWLVVNGVRVQARGACWMPPDALNPIGRRPQTRAVLQSLKDAGCNIVRVPGTNTYLGEDFHELCVRLGLLVWQDVMLHTLAPPEDADWLADLAAEVEENLAPRQGQPHLAVVSGGSETEQQPELWGLGRPPITALDRTIPEAVSRALPDVVHVSSTPSGGFRPTAIGQGISHWFGVGWYGEDFPAADRVRFAAETLALGVPPEQGQVERWFGLEPDEDFWRASTPRDRGAERDFADALAVYAERLFGPLPVGSGARLELMRAAAVEVFGRVAARWRRPGAQCGGGITIAAHDLAPGPGWGLLDSDGVPKASWYAWSRVWRPRAVFVTEEGQDGFAAHLVNDRPEPWSTEVELEARTFTGHAETARIEVEVPARGGLTVWPEEHLGFRDLTHTWGFGEVQWAALTVRASGIETTAIPDAALGRVLAESHDFTVEPVGDDRLRIATDGVLPYLQLSHPAGENWLHVTGTREVPVAARDCEVKVLGVSTRSARSTVVPGP